MKRLVLSILLSLLPVTAAVIQANAQVMRQNENLSIFFTSDVQGEVISCGCPILDLGGATHRAAFLDTLRSSGWEFLNLDAGGLVPFGEMNALKHVKIEHLARAMALMGFDGIGLGDNDLAQGPEFVAQLIAWLDQPVIATNYTFPDSGRFPSVPSRKIQVREPVVGLVAFLDPELVTDAHDWLTIEPWDEKRGLIEALDKEVDVMVALAAVADSSRLVALSEIYPELDLIVGSHRGELPANLIETGTTYAIGGGLQGKYLGRVEIATGPDGTPTGVESNFLEVVERWGRRAPIDEIVNDYHRTIRTMMMDGEIPQDEVKK